MSEKTTIQQYSWNILPFYQSIKCFCKKNFYLLNIFTFFFCFSAFFTGKYFIFSAFHFQKVLPDSPVKSGLSGILLQEFYSLHNPFPDTVFFTFAHFTIWSKVAPVTRIALKTNGYTPLMFANIPPSNGPAIPLMATTASLIPAFLAAFVGCRRE